MQRSKQKQVSQNFAFLHATVPNLVILSANHLTDQLARKFCRRLVRIAYAYPIVGGTVG